MLGFLFKEKRLNDSGQKLFLSIIEQSRHPVFYADLKVSDSLDGRFDVMVLHMAIVLDKLDQHNHEEPEAKLLKRVLQEIMFDNLDLTLREIGVGDLGVGKKIKAMAEAFYGRVKAYHKLFASNDIEGMSEALSRNVYRGVDVDEEILHHISGLVYNMWQEVSAQPIKKILAGEIIFQKPVGHKND